MRVEKERKKKEEGRERGEPKAHGDFLPSGKKGKKQEISLRRCCSKGKRKRGGGKLGISPDRGLPAKKRRKRKRKGGPSQNGCSPSPFFTPFPLLLKKKKKKREKKEGRAGERGTERE